MSGTDRSTPGQARAAAGAWQLAPEYALAALEPRQSTASLRLCLAVRKEPDPAGGRLVVLRDLVDARVLLGVVCDAGGAVHELLEIWIQDPDRLGDVPVVARPALTNHALDQRWGQLVDAQHELDGPMLIAAGWEKVNPLPIFVDLAAMEPAHPLESASGRPWELCRDDAVLARRDLPAYGTSLHRYLWVPQLGEQSPMLAVTAEAPLGANVRPIGEVLGGEALLPVNPGGGLMLVRRACVLTFEEHLHLLRGGTWEGLAHGRGVVSVGGATRQFSVRHRHGLEGAGLLHVGGPGRLARVLESFHLRLSALAAITRAVAHLTQRTQRPILNLRAQSVGVDLPPAAPGMPALWTARPVLLDPGHAVALNVPESQEEYYLGLRPSATIYQPEAAGQASSGLGMVRIRQVVGGAGSSAAGGGIVEGTFWANDRLRAARNDLVWLRLSVAGRRVDLHARLEAETALASGEWRFRSVGRTFDEPVLAGLKAAAGVSMRDVPFQVLPILSTPADMYSLAVLAIESLVSSPGYALPVAVDEVLSLAWQLKNQDKGQASLDLRVRAVLESDARWMEALGPARLACQGVEAKELAATFPLELWCDALGLIVAMLPGQGPDSFCDDLGDAPAGAAHRVFEPVLAQMDRLLVRSRCLVTADWSGNREIQGLIESVRAGLSQAQTSPLAAPRR